MQDLHVSGDTGHIRVVEVGQCVRDGVRLDCRVCVEGHDELSACVPAKRRVERLALADVLAHPHEAELDLGVTHLEVAHQSTGEVGGCIVSYEDLEGGVGTLLDGSKRLDDHCLFVVGGNDYRDQPRHLRERAGAGGSCRRAVCFVGDGR